METINILIINGPNLNLTGIREPEHYGKVPFEGLNNLQEILKGKFPGLKLTLFQSNHEGEIIDRIHKSMDDGTNGIVINPGGLTHTSVALADALMSTGITAVEVHITNIYAREEFRRYSYTASVCKGSITGMGLKGYRLAVEFLAGEMSG